MALGGGCESGMIGNPLILEGRGNQKPPLSNVSISLASSTAQNVAKGMVAMLNGIPKGPDSDPCTQNDTVRRADGS